MRYLILLLFCSAAFWACQPEEACISSATSRVAIDFRVDTIHIDSTETGNFRLDSLFRDSVDLLKVTSSTSESIFWALDSADSSGTPRVLLSLDPNQDQTVFLFEHRDKTRQTDTLILGYQRRYRLISPDCPLEVSYRDLQVVYNTFDSASVVNTELVEPSDDADILIIRPQQQ